MMRSAPRPPARRPADGGGRARFRLACWLIAIGILAALGWSWSWYYAASIADRALAGWIDREAAVGRHYTCGRRSIGGFPFSIRTRCLQAAARFDSNQPPFDVRAKEITFSAQVFRPALLSGVIAGPVTLADPAGPPVFSADWSGAQITLLGEPRDPRRVAIDLTAARLDRVSGPGAGRIFEAQSVVVDGRIIAGSARANPVIETDWNFAGAQAPAVHPLLAAPIQANFGVILRGLKDFAPKPWPARFREIQAAGGNIEIKSFRIERPDAVVTGSGTLILNEHGRIDGTIQIAIAGVENIVPLLGIDQLIGQGLDRLVGSGNALDRLMPGLGGVVRQGANATIVENIKKMGEPTEVDQKPAIALPLRISDGVVWLGLVPLGVLPALF
jgi:hypothetical protein